MPNWNRPKELESDGFYLWPQPADAADHSVFAVGPILFAPWRPYLKGVSLTLQKTVQPDRSELTTGGTAILTFATDWDWIQYSEHWAEVLHAFLYGGGSPDEYTFSPVGCRIGCTLNLPADHMVGEPQILSNSDRVTIIIHLSAIGVLVWEDAFKQHNGRVIPGSLHLQMSYAGFGLPTHDWSKPLGDFLVDCGPQNVNAVIPGETVEGGLIVTGTDLVERVSVDLYPNTGQAHQDFGSEGGQIKIPIVTQGGESVEVKWTAQIKFKNPGWPTIPISGKLSAHDGWVQYIKPELWIANFTLVALPVDDEGTRVASTGPNNQVRGVLTLTASYIPVTNILVSSFDASNPVSFTVALPLFPDQPFGDLVLTVFATRDGIVGTQTRKILLTERSIVVSVYPGAQIKISTDRNP